VKETLRRLKAGESVLVFPEGTRVKPGARRKYRLGGAWLAAHGVADGDAPAVLDQRDHGARPLWDLLGDRPGGVLVEEVPVGHLAHAPHGAGLHPGVAARADGPKLDFSTPEAFRKMLADAKKVAFSDASTGGLSALSVAKVLVTLGNVPTRALFETALGITRTRGQWRDLTVGSHATRALATLHPAYLLRSPGAKAMAWQDMLSLKRAIG
jgi:hypothetical protein